MQKDDKIARGLAGTAFQDPTDIQFEIQVIYTNGDTGETDEQILEFTANTSIIASVLNELTLDPSELEIGRLFREVFDDKSQQSEAQPSAYQQCRALLCDWAFNHLGWHDVTVDIVRARIGDRVIPIDVDTMDVQMWSLQLVRGDGEPYMYFYQD